MTACAHGMPSPTSCVDCMADGPLPAPPPAPVEVGPEFTARYPGSCVGCHLEIHEGERIRLVVDASGRSRYFHGRCTPG